MLAYIIENNKEAKEALLQLKKMGYVNRDGLIGNVSGASVYFTEGTFIGKMLRKQWNY